MHGQILPKHHVTRNPKSGSTRGRRVLTPNQQGRCGDWHREALFPGCMEIGAVFIDLRLDRAEPKPEHCPECGRELTFPMGSKHLNRLSARGKFGLSSSLFIRSHFSYMREIGQTVLSCRLCRNSLSQLCERGSRALGRVSSACGAVPHRALMP